jgi:hypothetical protein
MPDETVPYVDDIIVLALKVPESAVANLPEYARKLLEDPNTHKDLQKVLYEVARENHEVFVGLPAADPKKAATAVVSKSGEVLGKALLEEIKKSPSVTKLKDAVSKFGGALKAKPLGVFLDNASSTIFLVAWGASLVGIATIYEIQSGTPITNTALSLLDNTQVKLKWLTLELGKLRVDYSKGKVELKTFVTKEWKPLTVKLGVSGEVFASGQKIQNANGSVQVIVPVPGTPIKVTGKAEYDQNTAAGLSVGFNYERDGLKIDLLAAAKNIGLQEAGKGIGLPGVPPKGGVDLSAKGTVGADFKLWGQQATVGAEAGVSNNSGLGGVDVRGNVYFQITTDFISKKKK